MTEFILPFLVGFIVGNLILLIGYTKGKSVAEKRFREGTTKPVCGCGHHRSFHNTEGCHQVIERYKVGGVISYSTCPCKCYSGPEPLPEFYMPSIENGEK